MQLAASIVPKHSTFMWARTLSCLHSVSIFYITVHFTHIWKVGCTALLLQSLYLISQHAHVSYDYTVRHDRASNSESQKANGKYNRKKPEQGLLETAHPPLPYKPDGQWKGNLSALKKQLSKRTLRLTLKSILERWPNASKKNSVKSENSTQTPFYVLVHPGNSPLHPGAQKEGV